MIVDYNAIPPTVLEWIADKVDGKPINYLCPAFVMAWGMGLTDEKGDLTHEGMTAYFLYQEQANGKPVVEITEGQRFKPEDVPPEFRDDGKPEGELLTATYIAQEWELRGPHLTKHYGPGKELTTHIKVGRAKVYLFRELKALRERKNTDERDNIH